MSPDVFLHSQGLRYDVHANLGTTDPAVIASALKTLNATRKVDGETGDLADNVYTTPDFIAGAVTAASTSPANVKAEQAASVALQKAVKTGSLAQAHAAVDALNKVRMAMGGQGPAVPPSDLEIISHQNTPEGRIAREIRRLRGELMKIDSEGVDWDDVRRNGSISFPAGNLCHPILFGGVVKRDSEGEVTGWWDTVDAFNALNDYTG